MNKQVTKARHFGFLLYPDSIPDDWVIQLEKLDVSIAFLSRVERGSSKINIKRLTQIAELLNVSPAYLLTGSNTVSKDYLKEDFRIILEKCTPEQQKLIYQISELISKTNLVSEKI